MSRNVKPFGQLKNVIWREYNFYSTATGGKTTHTRVAAKFEMAIQGKFYRNDGRWVFFFTKDGFFFGAFSFVSHYIT